VLSERPISTAQNSSPARDLEQGDLESTVLKPEKPTQVLSLLAFAHPLTDALRDHSSPSLSQML
jgi:hypothetical protein